MKRFFWSSAVVLFVAASLAARTSPAMAVGGAVCLRADLSGPAIGGLTPKGRAEYCQDTDRRTLKVQVEDLNVPDGTQVAVSVNGTGIGSATVVFRKASLQLNTKDGNFVPVIQGGDTVNVFGASNQIVASGKF